MKYSDTAIARHISESKYSVNFIAIALGMMNDRECDLNGRIAVYVNDMSALKRKAIHEMEEERWHYRSDPSRHPAGRSCRD